MLFSLPRVTVLLVLCYLFLVYFRHYSLWGVLFSLPRDLFLFFLKKTNNKLRIFYKHIINKFTYLLNLYYLDHMSYVKRLLTLLSIFSYFRLFSLVGCAYLTPPEYSPTGDLLSFSDSFPLWGVLISLPRVFF